MPEVSSGAQTLSPDTQEGPGKVWLPRNVTSTAQYAQEETKTVPAFAPANRDINNPNTRTKIKTRTVAILFSIETIDSMNTGRSKITTESKTAISFATITILFFENKTTSLSSTFLLPPELFLLCRQHCPNIISIGLFVLYSAMRAHTHRGEEGQRLQYISTNRSKPSALRVSEEE
jgi:hypothetical protein